MKRRIPADPERTGQSNGDARPCMESLRNAGNPLWISGLFYLPGNRSHLDIGSNTGSTLRGLAPGSIVCIEQYEPAVRQLREQSFEVLHGDALEIADSLVREGRLFDRVTLFDFIEHLERPQGERLLELVERLAVHQVLLFIPLETDELVESDEYRAFMAQMFNAIPHDQHALQQHRSRWSPADFRNRGYEILLLNEFHMKGFSAFFAVKHKFKSDHAVTMGRIRRFLNEMNQENTKPLARGQRTGKTVNSTGPVPIQFGCKGPASRIINPALIHNPDRIFIGDRVFIQAGARLEAITAYQGVTYSPTLVIEDGVTIELDVHIGSANYIRIGKNVMIAGRVTILDHDHGYEDPAVPPVRQPLKVGEIDIDDHAWIGENVFVCKNVHIGKHAVVGANSVVTRDIPPFSVAAGNQATVIKAYDYLAGEWQRVSEETIDSLLMRRAVHAENLYQLALEASSAQQHEEAASLLDELLKFHPDHALAHNDLGVICLRRGDLIGALHHCEKSVELDPGSPKALKDLAELYFTSLDRTDDALEIYRRIVSEYPDDVEAINRLNCMQKCQEQLRTGRRVCESVREQTLIDSMHQEEGSILLRVERDGVIPELTSIVILTYNELKYTRECLDSIRKHTPELHEVILVDNGSSDGTPKWLRKIVAENINYRLIENRENLGFAKGCNQGISASQGEFILLLNNDVVVTDGWLAGMLEHLKRSAGAGIVGPMTNNISGPQKVPTVEYKKIDEMHEYARRFRIRNRHRRVHTRRIVGFCMLFRRELIERVGFIDESFGSGNFEDDDFCLRAALAGYQNQIAGDVFIHHYGSRTFIGNRIDYSSAMARNGKLFREKWNSCGERETRLQLHLLNVIDKAKQLHQSEQTDKAIDVLLEGLKVSAKRPDLYIALAEIFVDAKQPEKALEVLDQAPENHSHTRMLDLTATCRENLNHFEEAEVIADRLLDSNPSSAFATNLKGLIAYKKGNASAALEYFERAVACDPSFGEPYTNLGILHWESDRKEESLKHLEHGFVLSPTSVDMATSYLSAASQLGELAIAEKTVREAMAIHPFNKRLRTMLVDVLLQQGKDSEAMEAIEDLIIHHGHDEGLLNAALAVREKAGPLKVRPERRGEGNLSVCMIVKNEEDCLAKCLSSVKPVADEMIVVDTGSEDRTKDVAAVFGAKVYDFDWTGDFAEARNFSLSKASCAWILVLDADEVISRRDYERIASIVAKRGQTKAYFLTTRNYVDSVTVAGWQVNRGEYPEEEKGTGWIPSTKVRLFPNNRRIRFQHEVHELVEPSLKTLRIQTMQSDIPVHHYGKLNVKRVNVKEETYYHLGQQKLQNNMGDRKALLELAKSASGNEKHHEAVQLWQEVIKLSPEDAAAYFGLGSSLLLCGDYSKAMSACETAFTLDKNLKEAVYNYSLCAVHTGEHLPRAIEALEKLLGKNPDYPPALGMLGILCIMTDQRERGLEHIQRVKQLGYSGPDCFYQNAKRLLEGGRPEAAVKLLQTALETENGNMNIMTLLAQAFKSTGSAPQAAVQAVS